MSKLITVPLSVISICVSTFDAVAQGEQSPSFHQSAYVFYVRIAELTVPKPRISGKDNIIRNGNDEGDTLYNTIMLRNEYNQKWLTISNDGRIVATADNEKGAGRFVIWKTTKPDPTNPNSTDKHLHNGDYFEIRTTQGNLWIEIVGDKVLIKSTDRKDADELFVNKVTPQDPKTPDSLTDTIHDGDYIVIRGKNSAQGDPWVHFAGTELVARALGSHPGSEVTRDSTELGWFNFIPCSKMQNLIPKFAPQRVYVYADAPNISLIGNEVQSCSIQALAVCIGASIYSSPEQCLPSAQTYLLGCLAAKGKEIQEKAANIKLRHRPQCMW